MSQKVQVIMLKKKRDKNGDSVQLHAQQSLHVSLVYYVRYVLNFCILSLILQTSYLPFLPVSIRLRVKIIKNIRSTCTELSSRKKPQKERNPITLQTGPEEPDDPQQGGKNKGIRRILTANADGHVTFETTRLLIQNAPKKNCIDCTQVLRTPLVDSVYRANVTFSTFSTLIILYIVSICPTHQDQ